MGSVYPREVRLAMELIDRLGRPLDDLLVQQNAILRDAAMYFTRNYQGENPFVLTMAALLDQRPHRLTLGQMLGVLRVMRRELATVAA